MSATSPSRQRKGEEFLALARRNPKARSAAARRQRSLLREAIDTLDGTAQGVLKRGQIGSLADRDPHFVAESLQLIAPLADNYFRGEVRHLERIPASGPVLCVGNHSGGLITPDSWVFMVNFFRHFGVQRDSYALAHSMILGLPWLGDMLRRLGCLPAHPEHARNALRRGGCVLVYPGGDEDVFRPWRDRNRIQLAKRTGFVRLALQERVPIVPVVSIGGHETVFVLSDGRGLARRLGMGRFRIKALPLVLGPPWGISPGDYLGHLPLPAKVTVDVCEPIDFHRQFGDLDHHDPEVIWACYRLVEKRMQERLDALARERRLPVIG